MRALGASFLTFAVGVAVLGFIPAVIADGGHEHGHNHGGESGGMKMSDADKPLPEDQYPPTYFALSEHTAAIYAHIALMVVAWVFVLPVGKIKPHKKWCCWE